MSEPTMTVDEVMRGAKLLRELKPEPLRIMSEGVELLAVRHNGDVVLRDKVIGNDPGLTEFLVRYGQQLYEVMELLKP